jgi:hypothetical protein
MLQQIEVRRPNNPEGVPPNYIWMKLGKLNTAEMINDRIASI